MVVSGGGGHGAGGVLVNTDASVGGGVKVAGVGPGRQAVKDKIISN